MNDVPAGAPRRLAIVLVEDHADTRECLCLHLRSLGHTVHAADSLGSAVALLARTPCDVVLSDIGLPDGDGWELLARARVAPETYAIAMSGFGTCADESRSRAAGFRHHLTKPFVPEVLEVILEKVARSSAAA